MTGVCMSHVQSGTQILRTWRSFSCSEQKPHSHSVQSTDPQQSLLESCTFSRFQSRTRSTRSNPPEVISSLHSCMGSIYTWFVNFIKYPFLLLYRYQVFLFALFCFVPVSLSSFEPESDAAQACSNSWSSCLGLMSAAITGMSYCTQYQVLSRTICSSSGCHHST